MTALTGPLPAFAPLSDFASPTLEIPLTTGADDHPLDDVLLASDMRLLAAMQRIGYLEASLEHWQAEAERRAQQVERLNAALQAVPPAPRRWFPFNW